MSGFRSQRAVQQKRVITSIPQKTVITPKLRPESNDPRLKQLIATQEVENFDILLLDAYHDALRNAVDRYAVETVILVVRLAKWAEKAGRSPNWTALDAEYGGMTPPEAAENYHGTKLIMRSLQAIIGFKAFNFPRLQDDLFAYTMLLKDLEDGTIALQNSIYDFDISPSLTSILNTICSRVENETAWTSEQVKGEQQTKNFGDELESEGRNRVPVAPEAGYGQHLTRVVTWYENLDEPLKTLTKAIGVPVEGLSKDDFIRLLAPQINSLPDLPEMLSILGPLAYGDGFELGHYVFRLSSAELTSWTYKSQRNQPFTFDVEDTDAGATQKTQMRPQQLYAAIIHYIMSIHTPGADDPWLGKDEL